MKKQLDHVALQVSSVEAALQQLADLECPIGEVQEFAEEGTREVYVGADEAAGRLLLIEPIGPGPYQRSLAKRGPGLHHIAIAVPEVEAYLETLAGSGWLLHLSSLSSLRAFGTAWLARPGVPTLVEVFEGDARSEPPATEVVSALELPCAEEFVDLLDALGSDALRRAADGQLRLTVGGRRRPCSELCS